MIGVQPVPDPATVDLLEHGLMLPVPACQNDSVLLEPRDGGNVRTLTARGVRLERNGATVFRCTNVRIGVFITDARVALACSKYDKGGGWIGTPGAMIMMNAASKGLAAIRRHGKMMVGQVRYPWIVGVGSTARLGMGSEERLVLDCKSDQANRLRLTVYLPRDIDSAAVAAEVARRAAHYRLRSEADLAEDKRSAFTALTLTQPLPAGPKNVIQFHRMPTFFFVNAHSARMAPTGAVPPPPPVAEPPPTSSTPCPQVAPATESPSTTAAAIPAIPADPPVPSTTAEPPTGPARERIVITLNDL